MMNNIEKFWNENYKDDSALEFKDLPDDFKKELAKSDHYSMWKLQEAWESLVSGVVISIDNLIKKFTKMDKANLGDTVLYYTTNEQRKKMSYSATCNSSNKLPAQVVGVWPGGLVNLKVNLDGDGQLWTTSVAHGTGEGQWEWLDKKSVYKRKKWSWRGLFGTVLVLLFAVQMSAQLNGDKLNHIWTTAVISSGATGLSWKFYNEHTNLSTKQCKNLGWFTGFATAMVTGTIKETVDKRRGGEFSGGDMKANFWGALGGSFTMRIILNPVVHESRVPVKNVFDLYDAPLVLRN